MEKTERSIALLKNGNQKEISVIYTHNRDSFIRFASRYPIDNEDIIDIYQDAFVALYENAKKGLLDNLQSSINTYLLGIGKYMIYRKLKNDKKMGFDEAQLPDDLNWDFFEEEQGSAEIQLLQKAWGRLGEKCKKILTLFYYEEKKMDEIMEMLKYANKDVLKSQKSRCLKQLKELTTTKNG